MRWKPSILSFNLALLFGICVGITPSIYDRVWPLFSRDEAGSKLGHRVRYQWTEKVLVWKCFERESCLVVGDGEYGTFVGVEEITNEGYFLLVRWDHPADHYSYVGRYTHRESLVEQ